MSAGVLAMNVTQPTVGLSPQVALPYFGQHHTPVHKKLDKDNKVTLAVRRLNSDLTCPICLCIMRKTVAVTACMHRFCSNCIETSLRLGKKECPACRSKCVSRRNLRRDETFDKLIQTFYPDLESAEKQQDVVTCEIIKELNPQAVTEALLATAGRQIEAAKRKEPSANSSNTPSEVQRVPKKPRRYSRVARGAPSVNFSLRKFTPPAATPVTAGAPPGTPGLFSTRQEMRTEAHVAIKHLKTFLAKRQGNNIQPEQIRIWFGTHAIGAQRKDAHVMPHRETRPARLPDDLSVGVMRAQYWPWEGDIDLVFALEGASAGREVVILD
eukprot:106863_1